jgi:hypothetical protein
MHGICTRALPRATRSRLTTIAYALLTVGFFGDVAAQSTPTPVYQRGYDHWVTGANLNETTLNLSNVNETDFGMIFSVPVDDAIFAQPLYVPNVAVPNQGTHNVVYIATMSDTLYALDAESGAELWTINLASLVDATPVAIAKFALSGNKNIVGNLGILSTPIIDPSTNLMYVVTCTLENNAMAYRLWAVSITDGSRPMGPTDPITASYKGVTFDARYQWQRASLALSGNEVLIGFGALELEASDQYSGWMMAYDKSTLAQSNVFATLTKAGLGGGVWQSGRPPAINDDGYAFVFVGNAYTSGYDGVNNFSESALKLNPAKGLKLTDWFTPYNWSELDNGDQDLASSGPLLIPSTNPPMLAGGGKQGEFYLIDTANMGRYTSGSDDVLQEFSMTNEFRGGPVIWVRSTSNGGDLLFNWGSNDVVKSFAFNGTKFVTSPTTESSVNEAYPGGILALSAWGSRNNTGILWATVSTSGDAENDPPTPGALYAFNADNLAQNLWNSTMNAGRDGFGNFGKLVPPLVANGRVYVATWSNQLAVYGLLSTFTALPNTLGFGSEPVDKKSSPLAVTVSNTGSIPLLIKRIYLSSSAPDPFTQNNNCGTSVAVNASCTISVYFTPKTTGAAQATLNVATSSGAPTAQVALSGTGS